MEGNDTWVREPGFCQIFEADELSIGSNAKRALTRGWGSGEDPFALAGKHLDLAGVLFL